MLRELHISNLAVISDVRIELDSGLNCFTGATGAGKSLVIGALEVLLGMRSPQEMLRSGADEGRVSGLFEIRGKEFQKQLDTITDVNVADDGGEILLTRRLFASGRTSASLNGNPITLSMLKQVAEMLVDVHGQHDQQFLLKPANQLDVLDQFANLHEMRDAYHSVYTAMNQAKNRLAELAASRTLRQQQLELYRFQADEIDAAQLDAAEYSELTARESVLKNLEKLKKETSATYAALYEADGSLLERLKMMMAVLSELAILDINVKPMADGLRDATIGLEEVAFDLSRYLDKLDLDPAESSEVADRLNAINRILNKYHGTIDQAIAYRQQIASQIQELEKATDDLSSLENEIAPLTKEVEKRASELSARRQAAAKRLAPLIEKQLAELGMEQARFTVGFEKVEPAPSGCDLVEFVVQTNPGLSSQPLRKIASGGELSRIMLAIKGILAAGDRVSVLVFDEIDANVGGRLGSVIGQKLRTLAAQHQVLCITHLPQIACFADRHLTVRKQVEGKLTTTSVRTINGAERLSELAEMIGGQLVTETTRTQARELLDAARIARNGSNGKAPSRGARRAATR